MRVVALRPVPLPGGTVDVVARASDLLALGPDDLLLWPEDPPIVADPRRLPVPGPLVATPDPAVVAAVRERGGRVLVVPDLSPETVGRVVADPGSLAAVEGGTVVPEVPALWVPGGSALLSARERQVLRLLLDGPLTREGLRGPLGLAEDSRAGDAAVGRLRRRLGARHVVGGPIEGWRFVPLGGAAVAVAPRDAPLDLGRVRVDLPSRRGDGPDGPFRLTAVEARLLEVLVESPGPVDAERLARRVWGRDGARDRLHLAVHRLRGKVGEDLVLTVQGVGYALGRPSGAVADGGDPVDAVLLAVHSGRTVSLVGPPGCGKSALARRAGAALRAVTLDVHGAPPGAVIRALGRARGGPIVLDGLDDPLPLREILAGSPDVVLLTARAPAGIEREQVVAVWPADLGATFPDVAPSAVAEADGLPAALTDGLAHRIPPDARAALSRLAPFAGSFDAADATALLDPGDPSPAELARRSLLVPTDGGWRMLRPIRAALASDDEARWARHATDRARDRVRARPFDPPGLADRLADVARAAEVLRPLDPARSAVAVLAAVDLSRQLGRRAEAGPIAAALAVAEEPTATELRIVLANVLRRGADPAGGLVLLDEAARAASPHLRCRALMHRADLLDDLRRPEEARAALAAARDAIPRGDDWCLIGVLHQQAVLALGDGDADGAREALLDAEATLARARWTPGSPLEAGTWLSSSEEGVLLNTLGTVLRRADPGLAAEALRRALEAYDRIGYPIGAVPVRINLGVTLSMVGRVEEADAVWRRAVDEARSAGMPTYEVTALIDRAATRISLALPEEAGALLDRAIALAVEHGHAAQEQHARFLRAARSVALGRPVEVAEALATLSLPLPASERDAMVAVAAAVAELASGASGPAVAAAWDQLGSVGAERDGLGELLRKILDTVRTRSGAG